VAGAGKEADGGKIEVGEVTNALESPGEKNHPRSAESDSGCKSMKKTAEFN